MERHAEHLSDAERVLASAELGLVLGVVVTWEGSREERSKESCADSWAF